MMEKCWNIWNLMRLPYSNALKRDIVADTTSCRSWVRYGNQDGCCIHQHGMMENVQRRRRTPRPRHYISCIIKYIGDNITNTIEYRELRSAVLCFFQVIHHGIVGCKQPFQHCTLDQLHCQHAGMDINWQRLPDNIAVVPM